MSDVARGIGIWSWIWIVSCRTGRDWATDRGLATETLIAKAFWDLTIRAAVQVVEEDATKIAGVRC